jgi:Phage minor capsid protein 2
MDPMRSQQLSGPVVEVFLAVEEEILLNIAKLLKKGKGLLDDDIERWQTLKLAELGSLTQQNIITIAKQSGLAIDTVSDMLDQAGYESINRNEKLLQEAVRQGRLIRPPNPRESPALESVLMAFQRQARDSFNLVNTTMLDQSQQVYLSILNETTGKVLTGTKTARKALSETAMRWAENGVPALVDKAGKKWSTEAYVSMVTRSMSNSVAAEMQLTRMDEYNADLIEVSSHSDARPDCAAYQGQIYSRSGKSDKYPSLYDTSYGEPAGLFGINCRHVFYPYIEGFSRKRYEPYPEGETEKAYKESQQQRSLERLIRKEKRKLSVAEALGEPEAIEEAKKKVRERQSNMRDFLEETDRRRRYEREKPY